MSRDELSPINCRAIKCRAMKCHGTPISFNALCSGSGPLSNFGMNLISAKTKSLRALRR